MVERTHVRGVKIETDKPHQNACIESFNGRLHDECLNEQLLTPLRHARATIET